MTLSSVPVSARLTLVALFSATSFYCLYKSRRLRHLKLSLNPKPNSLPTLRGKILFVSQTGTSKALAQRLHKLLTSNNLPFDLVDSKDYEPEDLSKETLVLVVASTWEDGKPPPSAKFFSSWLAESAEDFRVGSLLLSKCRFSVFGVGSRAYGDTFNAVARGFAKQMRALGATEIIPVWEGDVDGDDMDGVFYLWCQKIVGFLKGNSLEDGGILESSVGGECDASSPEESEEEDSDGENDVESEIVDLEDIAGKAPSRKALPVVKTNGNLNGKKEMVTPVIRANLEKQVCLFIL